MNEELRKDLLAILEKIPLVVENTPKLAELSNHCIHSASIYQDPDSITMAVVVYALSNMIDRFKGHAITKWQPVYRKIMAELSMAKSELKIEHFSEYRKHMREILQTLSKCEQNIKLYIDTVIEKAKLKKGSKIFEHGLSVERTAKLMGVSVWELMNYIGKTRIIDKEEIRSNVKARVTFAKKLFNVK